MSKKGFDNSNVAENGPNNLNTQAEQNVINGYKGEDSGFNLQKEQTDNLQQEASLSDSASKSLSPQELEILEQRANVDSYISSSLGEVVSDVEKAIILGLFDRAFVNYNNIEIAVQEFLSNGKKYSDVVDVFVDLGFVSNDTIIEVKGSVSNSQIEHFKSINISHSSVDKTVFSRCPQDLINNFSILPFKIENLTLYVAIEYGEAVDQQVAESLKIIYPECQSIEFLYSDKSNLLEAINLSAEKSDKIDEIIDKITQSSSFEGKHRNGHLIVQKDLIIFLVDAIFEDAIKRGTSDIHIEPEERFVRIRCRIDGSLKITKILHKDYWNNVLIRIKVLSGMNMAETRKPQDGKFGITIFDRDIDFRVSTQPTVHGENIVIRILDKKKGLTTLEELGFSKANLEVIKRAIQRPDGIIITVGPTGSGKTTTLYSILSKLNKPDINIMTLEDPVEYNIPSIRQTNINEAVGLNFFNGIKALVRQDPDIMLVGEVRDVDTAKAAIRMSMTGHKVFTTLHAIDSIGAIQRLADIGVEPQMIAGNVVAIISQRLIKKLCTLCKKPRSLTEDEISFLKLNKNENYTVYDPGGCGNCNNTGYKGRFVVSEVFEFNDEIDNLVYNKVSKTELKKYAIENGFIPIYLDAIEKCFKGLTTLDEIREAVRI